MIYVDTSALVPIFVREPKSAAVLDWLEASGARLALSEWTMVEFSSAVAIKVRTGRVSRAVARAARARVREFAREHCAVVVPGSEHFRRAEELAGDDALSLRAGDALHLAIAEQSRTEGLLCLDEAMAVSARTLGISVVTV